MILIGEVTLLNKEKECDVEWKVDSHSLSEKVYAFFMSPDFSFEGESWRFVIWPDNSGFIELRLRRRSKGPPMEVAFSVAFKTVDGQKDSEIRGTKVIKGLSFHDIRLLSKSHFEERQSQFLDSGSLTLVCTLKRVTSTGNASGSAVVGLDYSKRNLDSDTISSRKKKCTKKTRKLLQMSPIDYLYNSQMEREDCSHCKETFDAEEIPSHEKKCRIKCPECLDVVLLKNWQDHECEMSSGEDDRPLCEDFKKVLLNGLNYDLTLKIGDKELRAHKDILRARSQIFESMLSHDKQQMKSDVIEIPDCDAEAMEQFLCYIYTGKVDSLQESKMLKLYYIADKYDMKGLKEKCCSFIMKSMSSTNFCEVIELALNYNDSALLEHATEYFADNMLYIMRNAEWPLFMEDNSTVANELTIKAVEKLKKAQM